MKTRHYDDDLLDGPGLRLKSRQMKGAKNGKWDPYADDPEQAMRKLKPPKRQNVAALRELTDEDDRVAEPARPRPEDALQPFFDDGLISEVLYAVKSGKEATVYACRADPSSGQTLFAAKIYHARNRRNFQNDTVYREGRAVGDRARRAMDRKGDAGRDIAFATWVHAEYEAMRTLYKAGAAIPKPWRGAGEAILMDFVGDLNGAAPKLKDVALSPDEARATFSLLLRNVELWLGCSLVHGDLSPFNVLYWQGRATIIDFPQAVDARSNRNAPALLERDLRRICEYFEGYGLEADPALIADRMWRRFQRGEL